VKDTIGVEIEVLNTVVLQEPLEEVTRRESQLALTNRMNIGISSGFFSIGYGSPAAARHMSTSFFWRNPLFSNTNRSSVLAFDFSTPCWDLDAGETLAASTPRRIRRLPLGISSFRRRSSSS
jgi:hypothetical protein